jgi:hypothetical protein
MGMQVMPQGPADAEHIHAPMRFETLVFNGNDGLAKDGGEVVVSNHHSALQGKGTDDVSVAVIEVGCGGGPVVFQLVDLRQVDRVDQSESGQGAGNHGEHKQHDQRRTASNFAAAMQWNLRSRKRTAPTLAACFLILAERAQAGGLMCGCSQAIQASKHFFDVQEGKCHSLRLAL